MTKETESIPTNNEDVQPIVEVYYQISNNIKIIKNTIDQLKKDLLLEDLSDEKSINLLKEIIEINNHLKQIILSDVNFKQ